MSLCRTEKVTNINVDEVHECKNILKILVKGININSPFTNSFTEGSL